MAGYCCKRSSVRTNIIKVYGKWTLPTACAGVYSETNTGKNIVPEMFFGFYDSASTIGFDLGILHTGGNSWKAFFGGHNGEWDESKKIVIGVGETIYANGWVEEDSSGNWYAKLNLSRKGYDNTDIIQFVHRISNSSLKSQCNNGFRINREVSIAVNEEAVSYYESTNTYIYNAMYTEHTLIEKTGDYCRWTDSESIDIRNVLPWKNGIYNCVYVDASEKKNVLELRKDEGDVVPSYISATCGSTIDESGVIYASDCASIQFSSSAGDINGYTYTISTTTTTATITVTSTRSDEAGTYYYDLYQKSDHSYVVGGEVTWNGDSDMPFQYIFNSLMPATTYELDTGNNSLGVIYFTTQYADITLKILEVTSSSIKVSGGSEVTDYFDHDWSIQKMDGTWWESYGNEGRTCTFTDLESNTTYYITLEYCVSVSSDLWVTVSIYATTLPPEKFSWTYAGQRRKNDGTFELVLGETKGAYGGNGAEYFYISADEWNEYVRKLCYTKDEQSATGGVFVEEELPDLEVKPNDIFTARLYNKVIEILYSMDGIEEDEAFPNDYVTANCLNSLKDRLNAFLES